MKISTKSECYQKSLTMRIDTFRVPKVERDFLMQDRMEATQARYEIWHLFNLNLEIFYSDLISF
jgi:hypothetical protein